MKIYTRRGDQGETGLFGGGRVSKDHPRVEAYGAVDELNAFLGQAVAEADDEEIRGRLESIQHDLFTLGAVLATPGAEEDGGGVRVPPVPEQRIRTMEEWIDEATAELPELRVFVLPGGSRLAASLHVCRTVCRRAERRVTHLVGVEVGDASIRYLNRLSDLFFVLARLANARAGREDVAWRTPEEGAAG